MIRLTNNSVRRKSRSCVDLASLLRTTSSPGCFRPHSDKEGRTMSAFTYPGVYIEELPSAVHTITGVATSIAAFVGPANQGSTTQAVLVESWSDFQAQFGGLISGNYLGYAVNQFFANGGAQAYIVRVAANAVTADSAHASTPFTI